VFSLKRIASRLRRFYELGRNGAKTEAAEIRTPLAFRETACLVPRQMTLKVRNAAKGSPFFSRRSNYAELTSCCFCLKCRWSLDL